MTQPGNAPLSGRSLLLRFSAKVIAIVALAATLVLLSGAVEPADLLLAGKTGASAALVRTDFPDHDLVDGPGYDGQQYYAIAARLPDIDAASAALDSPRYRLERILAPALASLAPTGDATVLALLFLNILGLGLACGALAELCHQRGWPPAIGVVAAVPLVLALLTTCVDPLATGLLLAGLALVVRGAQTPAMALFALALLTREALVVAVIAVALTRAYQVRGPRPLLLLLSLLPISAWHLYLLDRVGGAASDQTAWFAAFSGPPSLFLSFVACLVLGVVAVIAWRSVPAVAATAGTYVAQLPLLSAGVDWKALPRVTAPAMALGLAAVGGEIARRRLITDAAVRPR